MDIINNKLLSDLEIHEKVIPIMDKTITSYGKTKFKELFQIMYFRENNLLRRREIILSILHNSKNSKKITIELKKIKKMEKSIKWLFSTLGKEFKDLYFKHDNFNSKDLLSIKNLLKIYSPSLIIIVYFLIFMVLKYHGININIKDYFIGIYMSYKMFISGFLLLFTYNINFISLLTNFLTTFYVLYQFYTIYNSVDTSIIHYYKCNDFKKHIENIRCTLNYIKKIYKLDKFLKHEKLLILDNIQYLDDMFSDDKISKFGYELLLKKNYKDYENKFNNLLQYIGLIDSFINISKLIIYKGYSFPIFDFNKKKGPYINANGLWSPYIYYEQVKNNCNLGIENNPNTMILTGPNTSGKSTYIRNIMLSIFLAQTLGITCCDNIVFTPFNSLFTYLDIPNISRQRESLFEAEIHRCMEYCNILESLSKNEFTFTVMDELLTSTSSNEGCATSFAFCEYLSQFPNSLNIVTTHFTELTKLSQLYPDKFKNTRFTVIENDDGSFSRTYLIEEGKSYQNIAIKLLKQKGYNNFFIDKALLKLKELNKSDKYN